MPAIHIDQLAANAPAPNALTVTIMGHVDPWPTCKKGQVATIVPEWVVLVNHRSVQAGSGSFTSCRKKFTYTTPVITLTPKQWSKPVKQFCTIINTSPFGPSNRMCVYF